MILTITISIIVNDRPKSIYTERVHVNRSERIDDLDKHIESVLDVFKTRNPGLDKLGVCARGTLYV